MERVLVIKTCLPNFTASSTEGEFVMKNVSGKLFSFFSGGSIGDQERVSQTRSASLMEGVLVISFFNVSVKLFSFINGNCLQLLQWKEYWWSRCLSNSLLVIGEERVCQTLQKEGVLVIKNLQTLQLHSMEGVLVIKNVSVKLFSFIFGGSIGDQERVCQTLQLHQWTEYWWSRTCLSKSSASLMEGVLVMKNVPVKLFC